jgi:hypothetical protein
VGEKNGGVREKMERETSGRGGDKVWCTVVGGPTGYACNEPEAKGITCFIPSGIDFFRRKKHQKYKTEVCKIEKFLQDESFG